MKIISCTKVLHLLPFPFPIPYCLGVSLNKFYNYQAYSLNDLLFDFLGLYTEEFPFQEHLWILEDLYHQSPTHTIHLWVFYGSLIRLLFISAAFHSFTSLILNRMGFFFVSFSLLISFSLCFNLWIQLWSQKKILIFSN